MSRAASLAGPASARVPSRRPSSRTFSTHASLASMKAITASRIGSGSVWYSAASMPHRHMRWPRSTSA